MLPDRVTVKVNAPSASLRDALSAAMSKTSGSTSSLRMTPETDASTISASTAFDNVTTKSSSLSKTVSPETLIVIVCSVSPAANETVPVGNAPPKSLASAPLAPLPATVNVADDVPAVMPVRVTRNVKAVDPASPSALSASAAVRAMSI